MCRPVCQTITAGHFPAEVPSRAQYGPRLRALAVYLVEQQRVPYGRVRELLSDLFGVALSPARSSTRTICLLGLAPTARANAASSASKSGIEMLVAR